MNYWLIALPRNRLEFCIKIHTFGLNRNYLLGKMSVGDKIAFFATDDRKIIGVGHVTEPYYLDDTSVFNDITIFPERFLYPDRIKFDLDMPIDADFMSIIDKMSFVKNLANWRGYFRFAVVRLSQDDWNAIKNLSTPGVC